MTGEPELHVEVRGEGPVVALAHGFGGSARNFRGQVRALADAYRVVSWDARGHARSQAPLDPGAYTLDALAGDVGRALDRAGAECAAVGGLSLGAASALAFARRWPERVRGLVLASYPSRRAGLSAIAGDFADAIEQQGLEAAGERFVWGPALGLDARSAAFVRQGFLEHPPHALAHTLRGVLAALPGAEADAEGLASLGLPALLLAGARDPGSLAAARRLAAAAPNARLVVVADAGHVVNLAAPAAFDAALREFLDGL